MAYQDPTADEMREFLRGGELGCELDDFDVEGAIYWFASDYHGGQSSNLYSALSTSDFRPGPVASGPEADSVEAMAYEALEAEYTDKWAE